MTATSLPKGITMEIRRDLTFLQTEPGVPDRVGTVELLGNRLTLRTSGSVKEQFLVTLAGDRIDFRNLDGTLPGFFWRRIAAGPAVPSMGLPRKISSRVVQNPPIEPVTIEMENSHKEELWVLVHDLRDASQAQRIKIPSGKSASVKLDRDAGSRIVEVWEVPIGGGQTKTEERIIESPAKQLYDISVYELFVQSISIDRTQRGGGRIDDINRSPKSVGLIKVPPGDQFKSGKTDIYATAKRQNNSGAVRRIDPTRWR